MFFFVECAYVESGDDEAHLQKAAHTFRLANIFGTEKVRVFSFYTEDPRADEAEVFSRMRRLVALAEDCGAVLYHENEKEIYGDTAKRCVKLLDAVQGLRCVFDPANFVQCGENTEAALGLLESRVGYYHVKDALADGTVVPAGEGDGYLSRMVAGIRGDTVLTLEPHLAVFEGYAAIDRTELKNKYVFDSPRAAFGAAAKALRAGIPRERILLDGGIGFNRGADEDVCLMRHYDLLSSVGYPLLLGASRKSFLGGEPETRLAATLECSVAAAKMGVLFVRVHDVKENVMAINAVRRRCD